MIYIFVKWYFNLNFKMKQTFFEIEQFVTKKLKFRTTVALSGRPLSGKWSWVQYAVTTDLCHNKQVAKNE